MKLWTKCVNISAEKITLSGKVVKGFQRGSKQLGVPTANIEMTDENKDKTAELVPGVYAAVGTLQGQKYTCALSIGWNPVYDNGEKTIEVFLVEYDTASKEDFYDQHLSIQLVSFIRAEALFKGFNELIWAIQCDIEVAKNLIKEIEI